MYEIYFTPNQSTINGFFNSQTFLDDSNILAIVSDENKYYISKVSASNNLGSVQWMMVNINEFNVIVYDTQIFTSKKDLISSFFKRYLVGEIYSFKTSSEVFDWANGGRIPLPVCKVNDSKFHYKDIDLGLSYVCYIDNEDNKYMITRDVGGEYNSLDVNLKIQKLGFNSLTFDNIKSISGFKTCFISYNVNDAFNWMG